MGPCALSRARTRGQVPTALGGRVGGRESEKEPKRNRENERKREEGKKKQAGNRETMSERASERASESARLDGQDEAAAQRLDAARVHVVAAAGAEELAVGQVHRQRPPRRHGVACAHGRGVERREEDAVRPRGAGGRGRRPDRLPRAAALQAQRVGVLPHLPQREVTHFRG